MSTFAVSSSAISSAVSSSPVSSFVYSCSAQSSSAVSSSAFSASTALFSALMPSSSSSSSTDTAMAYSDPRFRGFWGPSFYVEGKAGEVDCLLSDEQVQVTARFVYRSNVTYGTTDGMVVDHCFEEAGTYFGGLSICVQGEHWVTLPGGTLDAGFAEVTLDGRVAVAKGATYDVSTAGQLTTTTTGHIAPAAPTASSAPLALATTSRPELQLSRLRAACCAAARSRRWAASALPSPPTMTAAPPLMAPCCPSTASPPTAWWCRPASILSRSTRWTATWTWRRWRRSTSPAGTVCWTHCGRRTAGADVERDGDHQAE